MDVGAIASMWVNMCVGEAYMYVCMYVCRCVFVCCSIKRIAKQVKKRHILIDNKIEREGILDGNE